MNTVTHDLSTQKRTVGHSDGSVSGQCPVCALQGWDRSGTNLKISFEGDRIGVHCFRDPEHGWEAKRMLGLADAPRDREKITPLQRRLWAEQRARRNAEERYRTDLAQQASLSLPAIVEGWRWDPADVWESSPLRLDGPHVDDPRLWLSCLFPLEAVVWTGKGKVRLPNGEEVFDRGRKLTVAHYRNERPESIGPMVCPSIWKPGSTDRKRESVARAPYLVLDFDELSQPEAMAVVRWLREDRGWRLAAALWTGSKSVHAWFHAPGPVIQASLRVVAPSWSIDTSLLGAPEHPCRLPGHKHEKTGNVSTVLWLAPNP